MSYNLIGYQQTAVDELSKKVTKLLHSEHKHTTLVFQSPTGSGKTVMTAKLIETIIEDNQDDKICFLWVSIGKGELHKQSKKKLEKVFEQFPPVSLVEEKYFGSKHYIPQNEIVVVNWEKIRSKDKVTGEWTNTLMSDGEKVNFRQVLANTKTKCRIICIIDESHIGADSIRTKELMDVIDADLTIEMSATPKFKIDIDQVQSGEADKYKIEAHPVIEEGMIKRDIIINPGLGKEIEGEELTSQEVVLKAALNKRIELSNAFANEESRVNPLVLVQIPTGDDGEAKKNSVIGWLGTNGITINNGKLQVWLSEEKTDNLEYISNIDDKTEFLIFKQAIDTGWDCPRASILVKFREPGNQVFEIQTVGRILRMPEQKHYKNEILNSGYIFSNLKAFTVKKEDYNPNIIKSRFATKKTTVTNISLNSYYKTRSDYGNITSTFSKHLLDIWNKKLGITEALMFDSAVDILKTKGLDLTVSSIDDAIIFDYQINTVDFDKLKDTEISSEDIKIFKTSAGDLASYFERFIKINLNGFAFKRSVGTVSSAIFTWFERSVGLSARKGGAEQMQKIVLHPINYSLFVNLLDEAVKSYKPIAISDVNIKERNSEQFGTISLLENEFFNENITEERKNTNLYFYDNCYLNIDRSEQEKAFENYLEIQKGVIEWWYKNGVSKQTYFGIKYIKDNVEIGTFYPDYIVKFIDGRIGIFDTKSGNTAKEAKEKAEALYEYISTNSNQRLIGGIVTNTKTLDNPSLMINSEKVYRYNQNDWSGWKYLNDIF